jgi:glycosyltransferase involved in cell wall biosynthesis
MRCPTINEFPSPPPGRSGWPWTEDPPQLPDTMPDGSPWPKISIVTPSLNQGRFIEETIRSVLLQGYPDLEYLIIDGGSTDETLNIIKKYKEWLAYWVSEPDRGQSQAINKGVGRCTGDIFAWINSDDLYCKEALARVAKTVWDKGKISKPMVCGHSYWIDENGNLISESLSTIATKDDLITFWRPKASINQPSFFLSASLIREYPLDESLHFALDWELWLRLTERHVFFLLPEFLSCFRFYNTSKSGRGRKQFFDEQYRISKKYWSSNKFTYLQTWLSYQMYLLKQPFIKSYLIIKNFIIITAGQKNYERLKRMKDKLFYILKPKIEK